MLPGGLSLLLTIPPTATDIRPDVPHHHNFSVLFRAGQKPS
jgi:hypothetical protein